MEFKCNVFKGFDNIETALKIFLLWFNDSYKEKVFIFHMPVKIINEKVQAQEEVSCWWKFSMSILSTEEEYSEA